MDAASQAAAGTVAARIHERLGDLRAGERKVARALLANYPAGGLDTVASLGAEAGVSAPTVTRFSTRLGYSGFPGLQRALRSELNQSGSPLQQYPRNPAGFLDSADASTLVASALTGVAISDVQAVTALLASRAAVSVVAGRFSRGLADYFFFHATLLRRAVTLLADDQLQLQNAVAGLGRQDLVVLFDFRRYDEHNIQLAREAHRRGAAVVLFTDVWLSPAADFADAILAAPVATAEGFDSLLGPMALCDNVIRSLAAELGDSGREHLLELEKIRNELGHQRPSAAEGRIPASS